MNLSTENRFVRLPEVMEKTGLARSTIYRLIKNNEFPDFFKLSERVSAWSLLEIDDWMSKRTEAKRSQSK